MLPGGRAWATCERVEIVLSAHRTGPRPPLTLTSACVSVGTAEPVFAVPRRARTPRGRALCCRTGRCSRSRAITLLAALLRFYRIGHQGFWFDEGNTALLVHFSPGKMLGLIPQTESTPPLYYCVAWVWARLFGYGETGLRSLSAMCGVLVVPVAYGAGSKLISRRAGLIAAALTACSPLLIWYSQEARSYEMLVLLSSLSRPRVRLCARESDAAAGRGVGDRVRARARDALLRDAGDRARRCGCFGSHRRHARPCRSGSASWGVRPRADPAGDQPERDRQRQLDRAGAARPQAGPGHPAVRERVRRAGVLGVRAAGYRGDGRAAALVLAVRRGSPRGGAALIAGALDAGRPRAGLVLVAGGSRRSDHAQRARDLDAGGAGRRRRPRGGPRPAGRAGRGGRFVRHRRGDRAGGRVDRNLERPDWRGVAGCSARGRRAAGTRAILIQHYRDCCRCRCTYPSCGSWAAGGASRGDLDIVSFSSPPSAGFCWWGSACNLWPVARAGLATRSPDSARSRAGGGFQFTIVRMVAIRGSAAAARRRVAGVDGRRGGGTTSLLLQR